MARIGVSMAMPGRFQLEQTHGVLGGHESGEAHKGKRHDARRN